MPSSVNTKSRCTSLFLAIHINHVLYCTVVSNLSLLSLDTPGRLSSRCASVLPILIHGTAEKGVSPNNSRSVGQEWGRCRGTRHCRLALLGNLQLEVVDIHLKGLITGGELVDIGLDDFHPRKKSYRVG